MKVLIVMDWPQRVVQLEILTITLSLPTR
ncbi:hypothetical protein LINPERHAP1_LOCUS37634 [Linum perenne]